MVTLGAVTKPHGIQGELRVHRFNADSTLLCEVERVWMHLEGAEPREVEIEAARIHGKVVLMTFAGVRGREAAEALKGQLVSVPRDWLPEPEEGEFYHVDLIGLRVESPEGAALGEVVDVIEQPSVTCLLIREPGGFREVPLVDAYVPTIDLEAGRAVVRHVEDFEIRSRR